MRFLISLAFLAISAASLRAEPFRVECGLPVGANCAVQGIIAKHWPGAADLDLRHSQTLTKSAILLAADRLDATVFLPASYAEMQAGRGVYAIAPEKAQAAAKNLRALFSFVDGYNHILVDADTIGGVREAIAGKKVFVGPPSGSALAVAGAVLGSASGGLKIGEDFEPVAMGWGAGQQAFAQGKIDVYVRPMPAGLPLIAGLSQFRTMRMVGLSDQEIAQMEAAGVFRFPGFAIGEIPAGIYPELSNGAQARRALAYSLIQVVNAAMSDDDAYAMTAAFWDNLEAEKAANPALAQLSATEPFVGLNMPLHPGAARYYAERGVETPEAVQPR